MKVSIITEDNRVIIDGQVVVIPHLEDHLQDNIRAVQINGNTVEVEYLDDTPNRTDILVAAFQNVINMAQAILDTPPPEPTLEELQTAVCQDINLYRDHLLDVGFAYQGKNFALDDGSQVKWTAIFNLASYAKSLGAPFSQEIIATDNSLLAINADQAIEFALLAAARTGEIMLAGRNHKDAVLELTTNEAVSSYDYSGDWTN
ncbi:DUF4376 domain-containing protein [Emcibacter sp.]|uniref:DUF4376 domain-containing protein n=1 Tax=Emcibacter sp. TaxID=1979954 RepID=UPI002AA6E367|nr:DUF4376 domain-containing protein [Emcibacter sp.]